jgi:hypothetical protein
MNHQRIGLTSALIYTPISVLAAGIFFVITVIGDYSWVARIGGAVWIFILAMIITMPLITSAVKKRANNSCRIM